LLMLIVSVIYVNVYIKRQMVAKPIISLSGGLVFIVLLVLDYCKIVSLSSLSSFLFNALLLQPLWIAIPALSAAGAYALNYRFLKTHFYPEEIDHVAEGKLMAAQSFGFMSRFGRIGELIGIELKLILRHKRSKSVIYFMPIFLFCGSGFYDSSHRINSIMWLIFAGVFITGGITMANCGQLLVAWEGKFFDGILARERGFFDYFQAKYYLLTLFCLVSYALTIPVAYFGIKILWINTACCLFNIGINTHIILWFTQYNRKKVDLSQSSMTWKGLGGSQIIMSLSMYFLPVLIASIFDWIGLGFWGLGVLALLGIIGILYHNRLIHGICRRFTEVKYSLAESFRTNS